MEKKQKKNEEKMENARNNRLGVRYKNKEVKEKY